MQQKLKLRGIGISFSDHEPKEICYIVFYLINFNLVTVSLLYQLTVLEIPQKRWLGEN
jgi:hypothetical protein